MLSRKTPWYLGDLLPKPDPLEHLKDRELEDLVAATIWSTGPQVRDWARWVRGHHGERGLVEAFYHAHFDEGGKKRIGQSYLYDADESLRVIYRYLKGEISVG